MISRVADHCFWMGRYVERAENTARVLSTTHGLALDAELPPRQCWLPAIIVAGEEPAFLARFGADAAEDDEGVQQFMTWDERNYSSLVRSVQAARENARSVRDILSLEVWEAVNELYLWMQGEVARVEYAENRFGFYFHLRSQTELLLGLLRTTMLHDQALDFIGLGVLLERAGWTARVLDVHHHALVGQAPEERASPAMGGAPQARSIGVEHAFETGLWIAILRCCSGYEPFLRYSRGQVTGPAVVAFLLLEPRFPRSVQYCVHGAYQRLLAIRPRDDLPGGLPLERLAKLDAWLSGHKLGHVDPEALHEHLTRVVDETSAVCEGLASELLGQPPVAAQTPQ